LEKQAIAQAIMGKTSTYCLTGSTFNVNTHLKEEDSHKEIVPNSALVIPLNKHKYFEPVG